MIVLTGASDDLIEVDGDIREEFSYRGDDRGDLVAFSDGTILRIEYTRDGVWRITKVMEGSATVRVTQAPEDDDRNYSDKAEIVGDVYWVVHGSAWARSK